MGQVHQQEAGHGSVDVVGLVDLVYIKNCPRYVATNLYSYKGYEEKRGCVLRPRILFRGKSWFRQVRVLWRKFCIFYILTEIIKDN